MNIQRQGGSLKAAQMWRQFYLQQVRELACIAVSSEP